MTSRTDGGTSRTDGGTSRTDSVYFVTLLKRAFRHIMNRVCLTFVDETARYNASVSNWFTSNGYKTNGFIYIYTSTGRRPLTEMSATTVRRKRFCITKSVTAGIIKASKSDQTSMKIYVLLEKTAVTALACHGQQTVRGEEQKLIVRHIGACVDRVIEAGDAQHRHTCKSL
ncbi:hypothetical protein Btru_028530 [Bulinus truncatus]|nr:hypothetical protein Btru_028530 [Bulinus truncatus]